MLRADRKYTSKLLLFRLNHLRHASSRIIQLRISPLHQIPHGINHLVEKRLFLPQQPSMPNPAPQNLAQHIAASFIRRQHAVVNQESCRASMVGDDAQARIAHELRQLRRDSRFRHH